MIAVITYDAPHRKTFDLLTSLKARGEQDVHVIATPWLERKNHKPLFIHRPGVSLNIKPEELCKNLGYKCYIIKCDEVMEYLSSFGYEYILIGGAGILHSKIVNNFSLYNSHPGYLPEARGLDSLKWSIYFNRTIGTTLHVVDENTDAGKVLYREPIYIEINESFDSLARRVYENEIQLLSNIRDVMSFVNSNPKLSVSMEDFNRYTPTRRMTHKQELLMMRRFKLLRDTPPDNWGAY